MAAIRGRGAFSLVRAVVRRYREADGASHTRALAYQSMFVVLSGFIGFVGLASVLDLTEIRTTVVQLARRLAPGPSARLLEEAAQQGAGGGRTAMVAGLGAALVAGTLAMAQVERSANRLFGVREDRPAWWRYLVAFLLAVSAGLLLAAGGLLLGAGRTIGDVVGWGEGVQQTWTMVRWTVGIVAVTAAVFLLYRAAPREPLPSTRVLAAGAIVAVVLWAVFTALLAAYFSIGSHSSQTYGPLLAIVAWMVWCVLTSLALHVGLALASELSAGGRGPDRPLRIPDPAEVKEVTGVTEVGGVATPQDVRP